MKNNQYVAAFLNWMVKIGLTDFKGIASPEYKLDSDYFGFFDGGWREEQSMGAYAYVICDKTGKIITTETFCVNDDTIEKSFELEMLGLTALLKFLQSNGFENTSILGDWNGTVSVGKKSVQENTKFKFIQIPRFFNALADELCNCVFKGDYDKSSYEFKFLLDLLPIQNKGWLASALVGIQGYINENPMPTKTYFELSSKDGSEKIYIGTKQAKKLKARGLAWENGNQMKLICDLSSDLLHHYASGESLAMYFAKYNIPFADDMEEFKKYKGSFFQIIDKNGDSYTRIEPSEARSLVQEGKARVFSQSTLIAV